MNVINIENQGLKLNIVIIFMGVRRYDRARTCIDDL